MERQLINLKKAAQWKRFPIINRLVNIFGILAMLYVMVCFFVEGICFGFRVLFPSISGYLFVSVLCVSGLYIVGLSTFCMVYLRSFKRIKNHPFKLIVCGYTVFLIILFTIFCMTNGGVKTGDFQQDGLLYNIRDDKTANVCYAERNIKNVTIPDEINGYKVVSINENAFRLCDKLESITIPDSLTTIGEEAFIGCSSLKSITIPENVETIGGSVFVSCTSLETVYWNAIDCTRTGEYTLWGKNPNITNIVIGEKVNSLTSYLFQDCDKVTSITIPDSVTTIGDFAFSGCSNLEEVIIADSVTSIGRAAFNECSSLKNIRIPESVATIGSSVFVGCTSLETVYWNAIDCIKEGDYTLWGKNPNITNIVIGEKVNSLTSYLFQDCDKVTSITIPDSVTAIGDFAFSGCSNLTSIMIPDNVTKIEYRAFNECNKLTIYCETESKPSEWSYFWNYDDRPVIWGATLEEFQKNNNKEALA